MPPELLDESLLDERRVANAGVEEARIEPATPRAITPTPAPSLAPALASPRTELESSIPAQ